MTNHNRRIRAVVMGASWGGVDASRQVLAQLPENFPVPIFFVQHLRASTENRLPPVLRSVVKLSVVSPTDKEDIENGVVYVAPPGYHMLVDDDQTIALGLHHPVYYSRPSVDELFFSAGHVYGDSLLAVLLTGANEDGAEGMEYISKRGGYTVAQDPETAEAPTMPASAIEKNCVDEVVPLDDIGQRITELVFGLKAL